MLTEKGLLALESEGRPRNIKLIENKHRLTLPFVGRIAAGVPIEAIAEMQQWKH